CLMYCFFFSSRRRHTRFSRDWSSDVCSSDLLLLQLDLSSPFVFIAGLGIGDDGFQRSALGSVFRNSARAFVFARNHRGLGHGLPSALCSLLQFQFLNGKLNALSKARPWSSLVAVVVMVMSIPRSASTLSYSISGKIICSVTPIAKLPRPSNAFGLMPRKSRIRGMAMLIRRSRNSYMRSARRVTL